MMATVTSKSRRAVELRGIPSGRAGAMATARVMAELAADYRTSPMVRNAAAEATRGVNHRDQKAMAEAIRLYVERHVEYRKDPEGVELVQTPEVTLSNRIGDCDDQATLVAAMLGSVRVGHIGFALAKLHGQTGYGHVLAVIRVADQWVPLETIQKGIRAGQWPRQIQSWRLVTVDGTQPKSPAVASDLGATFSMARIRQQMARPALILQAPAPLPRTALAPNGWPTPASQKQMAQTLAEQKKIREHYGQVVLTPTGYSTSQLESDLQGNFFKDVGKVLGGVVQTVLPTIGNAIVPGIGGALAGAVGGFANSVLQGNNSSSHVTGALGGAIGGALTALIGPGGNQSPLSGVLGSATQTVGNAIGGPVGDAVTMVGGVTSQLAGTPVTTATAAPGVGSSAPSSGGGEPMVWLSSIEAAKVHGTYDPKLSYTAAQQQVPARLYNDYLQRTGQSVNLHVQGMTIAQVVEHRLNQLKDAKEKSGADVAWVVRTNRGTYLAKVNGGLLELAENPSADWVTATMAVPKVGDVIQSKYGAAKLAVVQGREYWHMQNEPNRRVDESLAWMAPLPPLTSTSSSSAAAKPAAQPTPAPAPKPVAQTPSPSVPAPAVIPAGTPEHLLEWLREVQAGRADNLEMQKAVLAWQQNGQVIRVPGSASASPAITHMGPTVLPDGRIQPSGATQPVSRPAPAPAPAQRPVTQSTGNPYAGTIAYGTPQYQQEPKAPGMPWWGKVVLVVGGAGVAWAAFRVMKGAK